MEVAFWILNSPMYLFPFVLSEVVHQFPVVSLGTQQGV